MKHIKNNYYCIHLTFKMDSKYDLHKGIDILFNKDNDKIIVKL